MKGRPNHVHGIAVFTDDVGAGLALPNQNTTSYKQDAVSSAPANESFAMKMN